ncbi:hypothetical protein, partial [Pseudomonas syringae]|uniref:hypothetical protein n=1 Tax=Pseudomonas syringae TaxID=317 RepID=UPI003CE7EE02
RARDGAPLKPRLFYPGVASITAASGVTLKTGERVTLRDFVLPRDVVFATVSGIVVDAAGTPAVNALVYLKEADY